VNDRLTGITTRVSVGSSGAQANGESYAPSISADGRYVAFASDATNLVDGDTNATGDVFVRDITLGTTTRVSIGSDAHQADGASSDPAISADGRFVSFVSSATNLAANDDNGSSDVFVHDLQSGSTECVSMGTSGQTALGSSESPAISADGRYIAFASTAGDLITPGDANKAWDVFVRDRTSDTTVRASVSSSGLEGNGHSIAPAISGDGRLVAFQSQATNLIAGDSNSRADVFLRDCVTGTTSCISVGASGAQGNGASTRPAISADSRFIAFLSAATNLVAGDTNGAQDVFVYDREGAQTSRVSLDAAGGEGHGAAMSPAISADGRYVAFPSGAAQLLAGDTNAAVDVFVRGPLF
jgi:Tol biopolymer transport system component